MGPQRNEANQQARPSARRVRISVAIIVAANLSIVAWGLLAVLSPQVLVAGFEQYTGQSWVELMQEAPEIASFFSSPFLVGALNVAVSRPAHLPRCATSHTTVDVTMSSAPTAA
jgi:hypothetical protein